MRPDKPNDLSKILFLDIETVPQEYTWGKLDPITSKLFSDKTRFDQERHEKSAEEVYGEKGGILAEFGKVICIGVGSLHKGEDGYSLRVTSFQDDDETVVLRKFVELLNKHYAADDHWLCGHNGKEFDFPYIARRCVVHRIQLPKLLDVAGRKPWELGLLDTMNLWSFGDRKAYTSLALLAHILGIPTPKEDITGADVARVYYEDKDLERIAAYCKRDVVATTQVFMRLVGKEPIKEDWIALV